MFVDLKAQLEERLGALFDPDSKTSAMALLEDVFSDSSTKVLHTLRGALDPDDDATPLGRWRAELSKAIHEQNEAVLREIRDLATAMAVREARVDLWERSTQKGVAFEELVGMAFTEVGTIHGDIVEPVGRERGCDGSLVGDIVVTLSPDDCPTGRAAFVLEAKTRKLTLRKTLDELDVAMANRESTAGIAVFSDRALAPTPSLFSAYGDKAVLVLDAELPDPQAVELAYAWARWIVRRAGSEDAPEADALKGPRSDRCRGAWTRPRHGRAPLLQHDPPIGGAGFGRTSGARRGGPRSCRESPLTARTRVDPAAVRSRGGAKKGASPSLNSGVLSTHRSDRPRRTPQGSPRLSA